MKKLSLSCLLAAFLFSAPAFSAVCVRVNPPIADGDILYASNYEAELNNLVACANDRLQDSGGNISGDITLTGGEFTITNGHNFSLFSDAGTNLQFSINGTNGNLTSRGNITLTKDGADSVLQLTAAGTSATPRVNLQRARGTNASPTIIQNGDILGAYYFYGYDGSTYREGANIYASVSGTPGSGDLPTALNFSTTSDGASSPTLRASIQEGGLSLNTGQDVVVVSGRRLRLDGSFSGDTYVSEASSNVIGLTTGGTTTSVSASGITLPDVDPPTANVGNRNSFAKAWGYIDGFGVPQSAYNVTSTLDATGLFTLTFPTAFANTTYAVVVTPGTSQLCPYVHTKTTTTARVQMRRCSDGLAAGGDFNFLAFGDQ